MYRSLAEIVEAEKMSGKSFWQVVLEDDIKEQGITFNEGFAQMKDMYLAMKHADKMYDDKLRSASGMVGTDGGRLEQARLAGGSICGDFIMKVLEKAVKMVHHVSVRLIAGVLSLLHPSVRYKDCSTEVVTDL